MGVMKSLQSALVKFADAGPINKQLLLYLIKRREHICPCPSRRFSSYTNFQLKPDFVGRDDSARCCTRPVQAAGRGTVIAACGVNDRSGGACAAWVVPPHKTTVHF